MIISNPISNVWLSLDKLLTLQRAFLIIIAVVLQSNLKILSIYEKRKQKLSSRDFNQKLSPELLAEIALKSVGLGRNARITSSCLASVTQWTANQTFDKNRVDEFVKFWAQLKNDRFPSDIYFK